jgi:hypothetical protein
MKHLYRHLRRALLKWWECRRHRCEYYSCYLAYGPADMPHETYHMECERASRHFDNCRYGERQGNTWVTRDGKLTICPVCRSFEERLRA